jgi:hypothetical protein
MTENKEETAKVTHNFGSDFLTSDRLRRQKKGKYWHTHTYTRTHRDEKARERESIVGVVHHELMATSGSKWRTGPKE